MARAANRLVPANDELRSERALRAPKASTLIARWLRQRMHEERMAPGDALPPEAELCDRFGVSRPTLREALRILEAQQLITVARGANGGARYALPDVAMVAEHFGIYLEAQRTTQKDLTEARFNIEPCIIAFIAGAITARGVENVRAAIEAQAQETDNPARFARAHEYFYDALAEECPNTTLSAQLLIFRELIRAQTELLGDELLARPDDGARTMAAHIRAKRRLLEAFEKRDSAAAETLWRKHLRAQAKQLETSGRGDITVRAF